MYRFKDMFVTFVVIASVVALMISYSAALKLTHREDVIENYAGRGCRSPG